MQSDNSGEKEIKDTAKSESMNEVEKEEIEKSMEKTNSMQKGNSSVEKVFSPTQQKQQNVKSQKPIDFTADISMEQLDAPGEYMTDEEIMNHLDEIENIVLDGTSFELQDEVDPNNSTLSTSDVDGQKKESVNACSSSEQEIKPDEKMENPNKDATAEESPAGVETIKKNVELNQFTTKIETMEVDWYEKKLQTKVATVKDRLSKLARVLELSYPRYKGWLDKVEAVTGGPICRLDEPRRCSLEKPHTNRWKFVCNRKPVQEPTEKTNANKAKCSGNSDSTMWRLTPTGVWDSNTDNSSEYPPFVMKAVKVFEDFLRIIPSMDELSTQPIGEVTADSNEATKSGENSARSDTDEKENAKQEWLWLLVRCNRLDELMLFATGRNIDHTVMDSLKQVYEIGPGKDCKVKSLYCKSITKVGNTTSNTTTFLLGSEALDEIVGGIKIQLSPKTNFWSNAAGAESLGNVVADLLSPTPKTTVVEIGCGTGLIGLMLASKCHRVIGLDSPSEVEEAEMTNELNGVKNASFFMGEPAANMVKIAKILSNCKAMAIVNTNTNIGRAVEVMTDLRKMSLKRLVMVTTLTKQSVRAILELTRPGDHILGNPFIPVRACVVDTLPIGPHFEVVILMERRMINKFPRYWNPLTGAPQLLPKSKPKLIISGDKSKAISVGETTNMPLKKDKPGLNKASKTIEPPAKRSPTKLEPAPKKVKLGPGFAKKVHILESKQTKNIPQPPKTKFRTKRFHSPERTNFPSKKFANRYDKGNIKPWVASKVLPEHRPHENKRGPNKFDNPPRRNVQYKNRSPMIVKDDAQRHKSRSWSEESSMRRGSPNRDKRYRDHKDQSDLRERLSSNRIEPEIIETVKKQQQMLDMAKQKLPSASVDVAAAKQLQSILNMVLEQTNELQSQLPRSVWDRIAPPENLPSSSGIQSQVDPLLKGRYVQEMGTQDILITTANREFINPGEQSSRGNYDRFNDVPTSRNTLMSSSSRQESSGDRFQNIVPDRYRGHNVDYRKQEEQVSQWNREQQLEKNRWEPFQQMKKNSSPIRKQISPLRHHVSSTERPVSPRRGLSPSRRPPSPPRRQISPRRRHMSPLPRRPISPSRRILSPSRRHLSPTRRQMSPPRRVDDEWDIPSRGAVEQNTWQRPNERIPEKRRHDDRQPPAQSGWDNSGNNDRYRKSVNQDKWDIKDASHEAIWANTSSGDTWEPKQQNLVPNKEHWQPAPENRWPSSSGGSNGDNWNIRGKESFAKTSVREEPKPVWAEQSNKQRWSTSLGPGKDSWGQSDKEDWNDLPDDAKDPWGDDGNNVSKDRWSKYDNNPGPSSGWSRENQPEDAWSKSGDNWQNKPTSVNKPQWQSSDGGQNMTESRWVSNDGTKKVSMTGSWQGNQNMNNSWPSQNYSGFQQSRSYNSGSFKDRR